MQFEFISGHCFRRTSATWMADNGASTVQLKTKFNWRSEAMANEYVENSTRHQVQAAKLITGVDVVAATTTDVVLSQSENATAVVLTQNAPKIQETGQAVQVHVHQDQEMEETTTPPMSEVQQETIPPMSEIRHRMQSLNLFGGSGSFENCQFTFTFSK